MMFSKQAQAVNNNKETSVAAPVAKNSQANKKKELEEIAVETLRMVIDAVDDSINLESLDTFQKRQFTEQIYDTLVSLLETSNRHLSHADKQKVIQYVTDEMFGYGPINNLILDPSVTEIMVNAFDNVYIERDGRLTKTDTSFRDNNHILHIINKIINPLGRRVDESSPAVDARLPDGSRVNAIIPPLALKGPSITIRKFSAEPFTVDELIGFGTLSKEMADFIRSCVKARLNVIVCGGTGSGKTTTLNALSSFIPDCERIVTIEDTAELQLSQDHVVTLESRPANLEGRGEFTIRELVRNSLRMRPDRIVVGEVRGGEALDMLQAMNTGHDGSISTLHANSPRDAMARLETMVLMAGMELPLRAIREQIASAVNLVVHQARLSDGTRKILRIAEVIGIEGDAIKLQDVFAFKQVSLDGQGKVRGEHVIVGKKPYYAAKLAACGEEDIMALFPGEDLPGEPQKAAEERLESTSQLTEKPAAAEQAEGFAAALAATALSGAEENMKAERAEELSKGLAGLKDSFGATLGFKEDAAERDEDSGAAAELREEDGLTSAAIKEDGGTTPATTAAGAGYDAPDLKELPGNELISDNSLPLTINVSGPERGEIGQEITLSVVIGNASMSRSVKAIKISDSREEESRSINVLPPGESLSIDYVYKLKAKDSPSFQVVFSLSADGLEEETMALAAGFCLDVLAPEISIAAMGPDKAEVGETITYQIRVENTGVVDLKNVRLTDIGEDWVQEIDYLPAGKYQEYQANYTVTPEDYPLLESAVMVYALNRFGEKVNAEAVHNLEVRESSRTDLQGNLEGAAAVDGPDSVWYIEPESSEPVNLPPAAHVEETYKEEILREANQAAAPDESEDTAVGALPNGNVGEFKDDCSKAGSMLAAAVPAGLRGVPLALTRKAALYGLFASGDRVDIISIPAGGGHLNADTVVENVLVLEVAGSGIRWKENAADFILVTVGVTAKQAERLAYASFKGELFLSLRSKEDLPVCL